MIIKRYYDEDFILELCDFNDSLEMCFCIFHDGYMIDGGIYAFETHNFGIKDFDENKFLRASEKSNACFAISIKQLIKAIKIFYPLNQYIRIIGL